MPSYAVSRRRTLVPLLPLSLAVALPLGAQATVEGTDMNAATDGRGQRSPLFFPGAYTLPQGARGISFHQALSRERDRADRPLTGPTTYTREQFASTVSAYWGVRDWLTLGGSVGMNSATTGISEPDPSNPAFGGRYLEAAVFSFGQVRAFGRARLKRSATGATQLAVNASLGTLATQIGHNGSSSAASVGLALAQRVGPLSLHLAPSFEARDNDGSFQQVAGAITFPLLPRVSGSIEGVMTSHRAGAWDRAPLDPISEMGGGLRFDLGRVKLDLGLRQSVGAASGADGVARGRLVLGTHVKF